MNTNYKIGNDAFQKTIIETETIIKNLENPPNDTALNNISAINDGDLDGYKYDSSS